MYLHLHPHPSKRASRFLVFFCGVLSLSLVSAPLALSATKTSKKPAKKTASKMVATTTTVAPVPAPILDPSCVTKPVEDPGALFSPTSGFVATRGPEAMTTFTTQTINAKGGARIARSWGFNVKPVEGTTGPGLTVLGYQFDPATITPQGLRSQLFTENSATIRNIRAEILGSRCGTGIYGITQGFGGAENPTAYLMHDTTWILVQGGLTSDAQAVRKIAGTLLQQLDVLSGMA